MPSVNTMFQTGIGGSAPHSDYKQTPSVSARGDASVGYDESMIDGTPMRVATIMILAVAGLYGLKVSGIRFNVTSG
jgi:hypothetical protein